MVDALILEAVGELCAHWRRVRLQEEPEVDTKCDPARFQRCKSSKVSILLDNGYCLDVHRKRFQFDGKSQLGKSQIEQPTFCGVCRTATNYSEAPRRVPLATFAGSIGRAVRRNGARLAVLLAAFFGTFAAQALAQEATIVEPVTDPSGAAVPNLSSTVQTPTLDWSAR